VVEKSYRILYIIVTNIHFNFWSIRKSHLEGRMSVNIDIEVLNGARSPETNKRKKRKQCPLREFDVSCVCGGVCV
jgi:hypothetical protein